MRDKHGNDWLLLLHQIPPKPAYFRAQVLRRLSQVGALPIKNSAYLLPDTDDSREDFEWLCREIEEQGGRAWLFGATALAGISRGELETAFRELRADDFKSLTGEAETLLASSELTHLAATAAKLARRFGEIRRIDFFHSPHREAAEAALRSLEERSLTLERRQPSPVALSGGVWVTRRGVKVDRIGSAWLIKRFIDTAAAFRLVEPDSYALNPGERRFDMFGGEFTHEADLCTFEVLIRRHGLADRALAAIAEIVHDIDLKDRRYERPETAGVARVLDGLCRETADDARRLEQGGAVFDRLYAGFSE